MDNKLIHQIGLTLIPKIGPVISKNLVTHFGSAEAVFSASSKTLMAVPGVGKHLVQKILHQNVLKNAEKEVKKIKKFGVKPIFFLDPDYPQRLRQYNDSPVMIYCKGNTNLNVRRIVSVVGTRNPSPRGEVFCNDLIQSLQSYGVTIVSGMAYGIDIAAHRACIDASIPTIGVMGHGLGTIYPAAHRSVAEKMMSSGALLTEFPYDAGPEKVNFPMRNRIIAAMCDALVVVETARKGGSIISAELANQYNKDVFAVPGRLQDKHSTGCNHLIKTHKAALIESGKDIAYVMGWEKIGKSSARGLQQELFKILGHEELEIVNLLKNTEQLHIDYLAQKVGMNPGNLSAALLNLEFKGFVKTLPGKRYILI